MVPFSLLMTIFIIDNYLTTLTYGEKVDIEVLAACECLLRIIILISSPYASWTGY